MDILYPRCAGLDVHKDSVVAAVRIAAAGAAKIDVRTFDTTTPGLLALSGWLSEHGCTHVAMEASPPSPIGFGWAKAGTTATEASRPEMVAARKATRRPRRPPVPRPVIQRGNR